MNRTRTVLALAGLCTLPLVSSCVVAAVAGATVLVTDELRENASSVILPIRPPYLGCVASIICVSPKLAPYL